MAEVLAQNATSGAQSLISRVAKTSDIVLLKRPRVFSLAIGWESAQVRRRLPSVLPRAHCSADSSLTAVLGSRCVRQERQREIEESVSKAKSTT